MAAPRSAFTKMLIDAVDGRLGEESRIAPYFPSSTTVVEHMLDMAELSSEDVVFDLGSGDGRIVQAACLRGVAKAVGVELDPHLASHSRQVLETEIEQGRAEIITADCRDVPMDEATVVIVYMGSVGCGLLQKVLEPLNGSVRIVVHDYPFDDAWPYRLHAEGTNVVPVAEGGQAQTEDREHRLTYDLYLYSTDDICS